MKITWGGKRISALEIVVGIVLLVGAGATLWKLCDIIEGERGGLIVKECPADSISKLCKEKK